MEWSFKNEIRRIFQTIIGNDRFGCKYQSLTISTAEILQINFNKVNAGFETICINETMLLACSLSTGTTLVYNKLQFRKKARILCNSTYKISLILKSPIKQYNNIIVLSVLCNSNCFISVVVFTNPLPICFNIHFVHKQNLHGVLAEAFFN